MEQNPRLRGPVRPGILRHCLSLQEPRVVHVLQELHRQAVQGQPFEEAHFYGRQKDPGRRRGFHPQGLRFPGGVGSGQLLALRAQQAAQVGRQGE